MIINDFAFKYFKFTIVPYGETQSSIIWKMSDLTAKRNEIAIPWLQILWLFGAITIFL